MLVVKHQVKDEDGVPCYVYKMPNQMLVKVGTLRQQWRHLPAKGC